MPLLIASRSKLYHYLFYLLIALLAHVLLLLFFLSKSDFKANGLFKQDFSSKSLYQKKSSIKEKTTVIRIKRMDIKVLETDILEELPPKKKIKKARKSNKTNPSKIQKKLKDKTVLKEKGQFSASEKGSDFSLKGEALDNYKTLVFKKIAQNRYYPFFEKEKGHEGKVLVCFTIMQNGAVKDIRVLKPCSYLWLNKSAKKTIMKSSPFPSLPKGMNHFKMKVFINYKIRK